MALPRFLYGDPSKHVDWVRRKREEHESRQPKAKAQRAQQELEQLFKKDLDVSESSDRNTSKVEQALHRWGRWAARPQFWQDLRAMPASKLYTISSQRGRDPEEVIELDPQSQAMHRAYHQLRDERIKAVLYLYYVIGVNFDGLDENSIKMLRMGRSTFYSRLNTGSTMVYNRGKAILEKNKETLDRNRDI